MRIVLFLAGLSFDNFSFLLPADQEGLSEQKTTKKQAKA